MENWNKILIAIDGSETSERAVRYVGKVAPTIDNVQICLLHVYPGPPPDYYTKGGRLDAYRRKRDKVAKMMLKEAAHILEEMGVDPGDVKSRFCMAEDKTISSVVLEIQAEGDFGTVVAGKRGVSKAEEFLFGSISNALARHSKNFTSWIVG
jgi:nucleotide-binding universal stress UspA family protein